MSHNTIPINVETITPVHIGSGNELRGNFEYLHFQDEGVLAVIDPLKIFDKIGAEHIDQWVAAIDQQQNILRSLPGLGRVSSKDIAQRIISIHQKAPDDSKNAIKEQIHLGAAQPTIPGSSLKGSIRTAILAKLIKEHPDFVQREENLGSPKGQYMHYHARQVEAFYLGKEERPNRFGELQQSPNKDLLRFLRIGDAYFDQNTCVVKNTVINLFRHGWGEKKEESSYYECIPANAQATATIQIPKELIQRVQEKDYIRNGHFDLLSMHRLFKLINTHTAKLLQAEIGFWEDEDNPLAIGDYLDHLTSIQSTVNECSENACVLRVGAASGWEFMTGGWLTGKDTMGDFILSDDAWMNLKRALRRPKNYPDNVLFPKTKKMIDGGEPLGFVKISLLEGRE